MKNRLKLILPLLFILLGFSSCLKSGLEDLPTFTDAEINNFKFEYRWSVKEGTSEKLQVKAMNVRLDINREQNTITAKITVPPVGNDFPATIREQVSLKNLVGYCTLSTAARIEPIGNTPLLGRPGDFSQKDLTYKVTAADEKTTKDWKLVITEFNK